MHRPRTTLRIEGAELSTTEKAEELIERAADSLFFDLQLNHGISFSISRLESRRGFSSLGSRARRAPDFPKSEYPHAPVVLYRLGVDRTLPPVIRYWGLYQVLEYFFPKYSNAEAFRRLSRHLRSPTFDPHRSEDVVKAIAVVGTSTGGGEREHLELVVEGVTTPQEFVDLVRELELAEHLRRDGKALSSESVAVESPEVLRQLTRRIYDIRCQIVHSKASNSAVDGPGLLPGTDHDDLISKELPILEHLAQQALIESAEPFRL